MTIEDKFKQFKHSPLGIMMGPEMADDITNWFLSNLHAEQEKRGVDTDAIEFLRWFIGDTKEKGFNLDYLDEQYKKFKLEKGDNNG